MTPVGHVSHVWDYAHWIPGNILPQFDPSHLSVAHQEVQLEIFINIEQIQVARTANFTPKGFRKILKALL